MPALLFAPERVKPYQQGCSSAMDLVWEGGGEGVNRVGGGKGGGGCGVLSCEVGKISDN